MKGKESQTDKRTGRIAATVSGSNTAEATVLGAGGDGGVLDILTGGGRGLRLVTGQRPVSLRKAWSWSSGYSCPAIEELVADRLGDGVLAGGCCRREDEGASTVLNQFVL